MDIYPEEAKKKINEDTFSLIVDVRTKEEWDKGHHPKSILIPLDQILNNTKIMDLAFGVLEKDANILLICRSGGRAKRAAKSIKDRGFTNVRHLWGSYSDLL